MTCKIILINPPVPDNKVWVREGRCQQWDIWGAPFPPFSLAMISTQLQKDGHTTDLIDSGPQGKDINRVIAESVAFHPEIAIIASTSPTLQTDLDWFISRLKSALPGTLTVAIGIHVSALPADVLKRFPLLDFVIIGEPEVTAQELVSCISNRQPLDPVRGLAYRNIAGEIVVNGARDFVENIDSLGFPDWQKIDFRNYRLPIVKRPFSLISFSRGCPFRCQFCATQAYNGCKLRKRSVASLMEEIRFNLGFGVRDFLFWTELMTLDHAYLMSFLDALIEEGLHKQISWVCNSRVDCMTAEIAKKMKQAGCWQIAFGFEFGDDRILTLANKGGKATLEQGRKAAEITSRAGIAVDGHFMMGFPGETPDTLQRTIDFACSLPLTFAHFYAVVPFPGAPLYEMAINNGWISNSSWEQLTQDSACLKTDLLNSTTVNQFIRKAYKTFYFNLKVFFRIGRLPNSLKEYLELARLGVSFYQDVRQKK